MPSGEQGGTPLINSQLVHDRNIMWQSNQTTDRPEERHRRMETALNANFEDEIAKTFGEISLHEDYSSPPAPLPPLPPTQLSSSPVLTVNI